MPDPIPSDIALAYDPKDPNLEACINVRPLEATRTVKLTLTGPGKIRLSGFHLDGPDAARFRLAGPGTTRLTTGQVASFTVVFAPKEARAHEVTVKFSAIYSNGAGRIFSQTIALPFSGIGKDCPVVAPPPPPPPPGGAGGVGGGAAGGVVAPAAGGGNQPGTEPPASYNGKEIEICLRFWKLPGAPAALGAADFDRWVADVNRIYGGSGVKFKRGAGAIAVSQTPGAEADRHCFDIFVGGPSYFEDTESDDQKQGHCESARNRKMRDIYTEAGVNDEFLKPEHLAVGTHIVMESGGEPSTTLGHELGHAMGLGAARPLPNGRQEHLDPDDGKPITSDQRLMHPAAAGTRLTDKERRIARLVAERALKGGPGIPLCDKSTEFRSAIGPQPTQGHFASVEFRNLFNSVEITGRTVAGFAMSARAKFALQLAVEAGEESFSTAIDYSYDGKSWRIGAEGPREDDAPALYPPAFVVRIDSRVEPGAPELAYGLRFQVPKDYFGLSQRTAALRLSGAFDGGVASQYPFDGHAKLDLAPPVFSIDLAEQSRELTAARGSVLRLKGNGWQSSTFTGQAGLALWLTREGVSRIIELQPLPKPIPERWATEVTLPDDLPLGDYRFHVLAACRQCGVETSVSGDLTIA